MERPRIFDTEGRVSAGGRSGRTALEKVGKSGGCPFGGSFSPWESTVIVRQGNYEGDKQMTPGAPESLAAVLSQPPLPQRSFQWNRSAWSAAMHDLPDVQQVLDSLPDRVDRESIREVVTAQLEAGGVLPAFASAMVWGYGDSGYGPIRVRWVLTGVKTGVDGAPVRSDIADLLRTAAEIVRAQGPVEGFRYLNNEGRIKHLAGAFFTKWLYFASATTSADDPNAAPILDKQVHDWLEREAGILVNIHKTQDYQRYFQTLRAWGDDYARTPVQVEKAIFGLATGRT